MSKSQLRVKNVLNYHKPDFERIYYYKLARLKAKFHQFENRFMAKQMFWLFFLAVALPIDMGHCANLTEITWCHAVNSQKELKEALISQWRIIQPKFKNEMYLIELFLVSNLGDANAIEADVIIGVHKRSQSIDEDEKIPIMGHPPAVKSDLSLVEFLNAIKEYHSKPENVNKTKIVKLDFKSIEATERSIEILQPDWKKVKKTNWKLTDFIHIIIFI